MNLQEDWFFYPFLFQSALLLFLLTDLFLIIVRCIFVVKFLRAKGRETLSVASIVLDSMNVNLLMYSFYFTYRTEDKTRKNRGRFFKSATVSSASFSPCLHPSFIPHSSVKRPHVKTRIPPEKNTTTFFIYDFWSFTFVFFLASTN